MLSYRHAYHAGNFADVLKHTTLITILKHLGEKPGAIHYVESHAGAGKYKLNSEMALKTGEYREGIGHLWAANDLPEPLQNYLNIVKTQNPSQLLHYPGSPFFAQQTLRSHDKLDLCELHNTDFPLLNQTFRTDRRIKCHHEDGYQKSLALMPPASKRGLVMIDPSYEVKTEYQQVVTHLKALHKRFPTGVYALWYPVIDSSRIEELTRQLKRAGIKRIQRFEFGLTKDQSASGMKASGMIVVNSPWRLKQQLDDSFTWLVSNLYKNTDAYWHSEDLVGE